MKKQQCWIPNQAWDDIESYRFHVMSVPEATKWVCEQTLPIATQPPSLG